MISLDPRSQKILDLIYRQGYQKIPNLTPQEARKIYNKSHYSQYLASHIKTIDYQNNLVKLWCYQKANQKTLLIYLHTGGFVLNHLQQTDAICHKMANALDAQVIGIEYSLAPEFKFPFQIEECTFVLEEILKYKDNWFNNKIDKVYLIGESSGGNLATATLLNQLKLEIDGLILICPSLDYHQTYASKETFQTGYLLDTEIRAWFVRHYLHDDTDRENPLVSVTLSSNLHLLPKTLLLNAYFDPLRDETNYFANLLTSNRVKNTIHTLNSIHCFHSYGINPYMEEAYTKIKEFIYHLP